MRLSARLIGVVGLLMALVIGNNAYENVPQLQKAVNDAADPNGAPEGATLDMKVPPKTASMQVELTYVDGTRSPTGGPVRSGRRH